METNKRSNLVSSLNDWFLVQMCSHTLFCISCVIQSKRMKQEHTCSYSLVLVLGVLVAYRRHKILNQWRIYRISWCESYFLMVEIDYGRNIYFHTVLRKPCLLLVIEIFYVFLLILLGFTKKRKKFRSFMDDHLTFPKTYARTCYTSLIH